MNTFLRFFYELITIFVDGLKVIGEGIWSGMKKIADIENYRQIIANYKSSFEGPEWLFTVITIVFLISIVVIFVLLVLFLLKKSLPFSKKINQDELLEEIGDLNDQVLDLKKQNDELMAMKVSQLGLNPDGSDSGSYGSEDKEDPAKEEAEEITEEDKNTINRFPKLTHIDEKFELIKPKNYGNDFTLEQMADDLRCFAASKLKLYYDFDLLRPFIAGLACGKLIILQGISGTGKTSLAYAWGKFVANDSCVAPVQPSWRDKTEFVGYFNEFTKKYNETEALAEIYAAQYDDNVHTLILDEMNIARVEYYFAEFLSILEMPARDKWVIELVTSGWPMDPKKLFEGKIRLPGNLWYIGTINNDDSTFMVTDKVYDRAMPIDINTKVDPFKCREQEAVPMNSVYLENLFKEACQNHPVSETNMNEVGILDNYVIEHFRVSFGNRIMKQLNIFVPVYVACGGKEVSGIDYFIAKKIFRKFEQLNLALIKDEIDPFISYLNKEFGDGNMKECIAYLQLIKKSI